MNLKEATERLHAAALAVAELLLSDSAKAGWGELAALEEASIVFYKAQIKTRGRRR